MNDKYGKALRSLPFWKQIVMWFDLWKHGKKLRKRKKQVQKFFDQVGSDGLEQMSAFFKTGEKMER